MRNVIKTNSYCGFQLNSILYSNKQDDEGTVQNRKYMSLEIDWTMETPKGWSIRFKERLDELADHDENR